ncbi:MAG: Ig-like domain-containing protein, partial [Deltaproteobacteria bacterium]
RIFLIRSMSWGVVIEPSTMSTPLGIRVDVAAFLTYSDGSRSRVAPDWSTADPAVARVFNGSDAFGGPVGTFIPLAVGQTTINARVTPPAGAACPGRGPTLTGSSQATVTGETLAAIHVDCTVDPATDRCNFGNSTRPVYPAGITFGCRAFGTGSGGTQWDITDSAYWSSSNPTVLQVSDTAGTRGVVRAMATGSGVIVATYGAVSDSRTVDVNGAHLDAVNVYPAYVSLPVGFTQRFAAEGTFAMSGASRRCEVTPWATWTSGNESVLAVGTDGDYRGLAWTLAPSATGVNVNAAFLGHTGSATVYVNDATISALTVVPSAASVGVGLQVSFSATGRYSDGSSRDVTASSRWSTGDSSLAVVSNSFFSRGLTRGIAPGNTVVRAEIGGLVGEAQLSVTTACVRAVVITTRDGRLSHPSLVPSEFRATATYSDGFVADVTNQVKWTSSDESVYPTPRYVQGAYVSTARTPGSATISASLNGCSGFLTTRVPVTVNTATLRSIALRGASGTDSVPINRATQFNAIGTYSDQTAFDITSTIESWALGNTAVAGLNGSGLVVGLSVGTSTLTATQGTVSGATTVTVTAATLSSVRVVGLNLAGSCRDMSDPASYTDTTATAPAGSITHLRAFGTYSDQRVRELTDDVIWTSDTPAIAVVFNTPGNHGLVVTRSAGTAHLRATILVGSVPMPGEIAMTVVSGALTGLAINPGGVRPVQIANGNQRQLALVGNYGSAGMYCASDSAGWTTSDGALAGVDHGLVTARAVGTVTVTANIGTINDNIIMVVGAPTLSYVEVLPTTLTLSRWSTSRFRVLAHYSDTTVDDVSANPSTIWSSVDVTGTNVVWVDPGTWNRGLVWALNPGQARIDACIAAQCAGTGTERRALVTVNP